MYNRIIYNGPPSRPHQVVFYAMQDERCLLFTRSSTGCLLLDLRPDAEHTLAPFGVYCIGSNIHLLHTTVILISPISQSYHIICTQQNYMILIINIYLFVNITILGDYRSIRIHNDYRNISIHNLIFNLIKIRF